jgi:glycosyltransferase involved in cell wall biosynthesis
MKISIIIPAKNEEKNILNLLNQIPISTYEIIVVDGNSIDDTFNVASKFSDTIKVVKQISKGKGAALSRGFNLSTGDFIIALDADGSNSPEEIYSFVQAYSDGYQLVKGSRYIEGGGSADITTFRSFGNLLLTKFVNTLFKTNWTDLAYGFVGISRDLLNQLDISNFDENTKSKFKYGKGFEIEALLCCRSIKKGAKIIEIPSFEKLRIYGSSNLRSIPDGFRALIAIIYERFFYNS